MVGGATTAGAYTWAHKIQVPLIVLINGGMTIWYYVKVKRGDVEVKALLLQILGTCLVLVQPVFDDHGLLWDMKHGYTEDPMKDIEVPELTKGGFWHHGSFMATCQVAGLLCIVTANLLASHAFETLQEQLEELEDK